MPELDVLYMTRVQRERFFNEDEYVRLKDSYILTPEKLRNAKERDVYKSQHLGQRHQKPRLLR